jgi:DNA-3-methyladenine glycosylase I
MGYCGWNSASEIDRHYHDTEWGIPVHDDRKQFEYLMMEVMQCGLSWELMLRKREIFRQCFDNFDFDKVAAYDERDVERIMNTEGMIRSPSKIRAIINNARCFQKIRNLYGSFSNYLWAYADGKTIIYSSHGGGRIPASNGLSARISKDLKSKGFKYLGTITVYSHLQACGIINDHDRDCPCYKKINGSFPTITKLDDQDKF